MKVIEIGPGKNPQAQTIWKDASIDTLDVNPDYHPTYLCDAVSIPEELYEKYDALLASHVLEHFPHWKSLDVINEWKKAVKIGSGEIHVVVPSLEWAAKEILSEHPSQALLPHLYGSIINQWDIHMTAFTLRHLRVLFESAGLAVTRARSGPYLINAYGTTLTAEQHYICGIRKE